MTIEYDDVILRYGLYTLRKEPNQFSLWHDAQLIGLAYPEGDHFEAIIVNRVDRNAYTKIGFYSDYRTATRRLWNARSTARENYLQAKKNPA